MKSKKAKTESINYNAVSVHGNISSSGILIDVRYFNYSIHGILIPPNEYQNWRTMTKPQRDALIHVHIDPKAFDNDIQLITAVVTTISDVVDSLILRAQQHQALTSKLYKH